MRAAEAGEVFLGGCVDQEDQPYWRCCNCGFDGTDNAAPGPPAARPSTSPPADPGKRTFDDALTRLRQLSLTA